VKQNGVLTQTNHYLDEKLLKGGSRLAPPQPLFSCHPSRNRMLHRLQ